MDARHSRKSGVLLRIRARFATQRFPPSREWCIWIFGILFAVFLAGCGGGVNILPEPFTRERADGKIPVKVDLIREQIRAELDGVPEGESEVARWQAIETDYNQCRLSSAESSKAKAEEVFSVCMSERGYVYMFPIDAEQFHSDIAFELEKERDERIAAEKKATEEAERKAKGEQYNGALLAAVNVGNLELVRKWLSAGANPNAAKDHETALMDAARGRHTEIVKMLLSAGANPNAAIDCGADAQCNCSKSEWGCSSGWTALMDAADVGHAEIAKMLLSAGANPNAATNDGWTALMDAPWSWEGSAEEVVKMLLSAGANPNAATKNGWTALMSAAEQGRTEIVKMLLSAGANPNAADNDTGQTALYTAARRHTEIVKMLLSAGANPNVANYEGKTALHVAAFYGHAEIPKMLLAAGANPNAANNEGETALHVAVARRFAVENWAVAEFLESAEIVKLLLSAGVDPNATTNDGETALDYAKENGNSEIARILRAAGAVESGEKFKAFEEALRNFLKQQEAEAKE